MRIDVLTLFPHIFAPYLGESIVKRAITKGALTVHVHNLRDFATDTHHTVDDTPYGGGVGMVLRVDVVDRALEQLVHHGIKEGFKDPHRILLTPQGKRLTAQSIDPLAKKSWLILICGHYEGFDQRIRQYLVNEQISIGDYVLTGGELPALVLIDAVARFVPGVLPEGAAQEDSFSLMKEGKPALEYPHYTRPPEHKGWTVPEVLISGNHAEIAKWRIEQSKPVQ